MKAFIGNLIISHAEKLELGQELAESKMFSSQRRDTIVIKVKLFETAHVGGLGNVLHSSVPNGVARDVEQLKLVQG